MPMILSQDKDKVLDLLKSNFNRHPQVRNIYKELQNNWGVYKFNMELQRVIANLDGYEPGTLTPRDIKNIEIAMGISLDDSSSPYGSSSSPYGTSDDDIEYFELSDKDKYEIIKAATIISELGYMSRHPDGDPEDYKRHNLGDVVYKAYRADDQNLIPIFRDTKLVNKATEDADLKSLLSNIKRYMNSNADSIPYGRY